jgi:hypothetical protein
MRNFKKSLTPLRWFLGFIDSVYSKEIQFDILFESESTDKRVYELNLKEFVHHWARCAGYNETALMPVVLRSFHKETHNSCRNDNTEWPDLPNYRG